MARPFDEITDDGTIVRGEIAGNVDDALKLIEEMEIPAEMYLREGDIIAIAWWVLDEIKDELPGTDKAIVERYPLKDGLVVERIPL